MALQVWSSRAVPLQLYWLTCPHQIRSHVPSSSTPAGSGEGADLPTLVKNAWTYFAAAVPEHESDQVRPGRAGWCRCSTGIVLIDQYWGAVMAGTARQAYSRQACQAAWRLRRTRFQQLPSPPAALLYCAAHN